MRSGESNAHDQFSLYLISYRSVKRGDSVSVSSCSLRGWLVLSGLFWDGRGVGAQLYLAQIRKLNHYYCHLIFLCMIPSFKYISVFPTDN